MSLFFIQNTYPLCLLPDLSQASRGDWMGCQIQEDCGQVVEDAFLLDRGRRFATQNVEREVMTSYSMRQAISNIAE